MSAAFHIGRKLGAEGGTLGEHQVLLVQQGSREVIDWSNGAERHGVVPPPQQIGTEDHSQVTVGHLIHLTVG